MLTIYSDRIKNCWQLNNQFTNIEFNDIVSNNCTPNSPYTIGFGNPLVANSATVEDYISQGIPAPSINGQLGHLSALCNANGANLIMQPTIDKGTRRIAVTSAELEILCQLGYKINSRNDCCHQVTYYEGSTYATNNNTCCSHFYFTCVNIKLDIPVNEITCNDASGDIMEITDVWSNNNCILQLNGGIISFTPLQQGELVVYYTVKSCDDKMDNASFYVFVGPCLDPNAQTPCDNLISTYDFEEFDNDPYSPVYSLCGRYWVFNYLSNSSDDKQNSVDICQDVNGNKFMEFGNDMEFNGEQYIEGIALKLKETIHPGCVLNIKFDGGVAVHPTQLNILGSTNAPCQSIDVPNTIGCVQTNCNGLDYNPKCLATKLITHIGSSQYGQCPTDISSYAPYTIACPNNSSIDINFIILYLESSEIHSFIYIDNLELRKDCSCAEITLHQNTCNDFDFISTVCDPNNTYSWNFGDPKNPTNNTSSTNPTSHVFSDDGKYTVTLTVTDECGHSSVKTQIIKISCVPFTCQCPSGSEQVELENDDITNFISSPNITSFQNKCIKVKGKIVINKNFSFGSCPSVLMEPGAEIEVKSGVTFSASHCHFLGCTKMWKSITVLPGANVILDYDEIQDAEFGVHAYGGSNIKLQYNKFYQDYVGIFVEGGAVNNISPMIGNEFYTNGNFLTSYNGQINIPGAYGYCGVLVKNNAVFSVGAGTTNYFYNLYNGVIGINSDLTVSKANIHDLITIRSRLLLPRKFTFPDGDGIFGSNCILTALTNTISITNGSITDYQGKTLYAYDNILSNTVSGIYCAYPKLDCYIDKNQITNYHLYGIGITSPSSKIKLMITRTDPFTSATSSTQLGGSTAIYLENVVANGNGGNKNLGQVQANLMTLDPYAYGIVLKSSRGIGLQDNIGTYSGITERNGIELSGSPSNVVYHNIISNNLNISTKGNAFYINDSRSNVVCCNSSTGTRSGFHFALTSTMKDKFRTNDIYSHRKGLDCDPGTSIDEQNNCANTWMGTYNDFSASHLGQNFLEINQDFMLMHVPILDGLPLQYFQIRIAIHEVP